MKKLLLSTFLSVLFTCTLLAQIPEDGLMGRYDLDNSSYADATSNGYDLTPIGTGTFLPADDRFGEPLSAVLFINDYMSLLNSPGVFDFDSENEISLSVWINIGQTVIDWTGILNNWGGFDLGGYYLGITPNQEIRWNVNAEDLIDSSPVSTGVWMHIVAIFDGTNSRLYIDGNLVGQVAPGVSLMPSAFPFTVGAQADNDTNKFPGTMDEVLVYNRVLTDQEIEDIFNNVPLGINDLDALSRKIKVAPNPAKAEFNITYDSASLGTITSFKIIDMKGSVLMHEDISSMGQNFDVSALKAGVYQITFISEYGAQYSKQLLKR